MRKKSFAFFKSLKKIYEVQEMNKYHIYHISFDENHKINNIIIQKMGKIARAKIKSKLSANRGMNKWMTTRMMDRGDGSNGALSASNPIRQTIIHYSYISGFHPFFQVGRNGYLSNSGEIVTPNLKQTLSNILPQSIQKDEDI